MNEPHYFADVNLPFHVWVREPSNTAGFHWVLRDASQGLRDSPDSAASPSSGSSSCE